MSINFDVKHVLRFTIFLFIFFNSVIAYSADSASGAIDRSQLPAGIAERASNQSIALAQSPEFATARASWKDDGAFVWQLHYQLAFRSQTDYLSTKPAHLAKVMSARPENVGRELLNLYMSDAEGREFERRQKLGERISDIRSLVGVKDSAVEGEEPSFNANFAGVWQDQMDGGALVVALVDPSQVDRLQLERIAGGSKNLRIVKVKYSWSEVNNYRDALLTAFKAYGLEASVRINSTGRGREIEIVSPDNREISKVARRTAPADLFIMSKGETDVEEGTPTSTHPEDEQQAGLQIEFDPGGTCTWGINGHTSNRNYLVTAGHCGGDDFEDFTGWSSTLEVHQNNVFLLTPGSQYIDSINTEPYDMKRVSSPQADSNCYHAVGDCIRNVRWRTLHNSWEVGSDIVCASLGTTNTYICGAVVEENFSSTASGCEGSRWVRYAIDTSGGDSGSGLIGPVASPDVTIDAIHACGSGTSGFGNTAYDVKTQLSFDFNCASTPVRNRAASAWGACPTYNR